MKRDQVALLVALGVDDLGSGLFLPLSVLYAIRAVGLPIGTAGTLVTAGAVLGLAAPPLAGRLVDRFGPRPVVIGAQLVQTVGAAVYLVASHATLVLVAATLLAMGQQAFYSSVLALIADTAESGAKDRAFALAGMVRGVCFGVGGVVAAAVVTAAGPLGYRVAIAGDGLTFLVAALVLAVALRSPHVRRSADDAPVSVLRNRPFLLLIVVAGLLGLVVDFFLVGIPVYVVEVLHGPMWLPGIMIGFLPVVGVLCGTTAVHLTRRLWRTTTTSLAAVLYVLWSLACLVAMAVPEAWLAPYLLGATVLLVVGNLLAIRTNALAEAAALSAARGRYLAAFQYSYTAAGIVAPSVVALFSTGVWLPWLIVAAAAALAGCALPYLAYRLPRHAVTGEHPALAADAVA